MKLFIISNRLPVKAVEKDGSYIFTPSEGGLATGLNSLETDLEKHWVGWPGIATDDPELQADITAKLAKFNFHPVFLSEEQVKNYYEGYSNSTIWPMCHYFFAFTQYKNSYWETYKQVNKIFADKTLSVAGEEDLVWVQDYHLMLLPGMLRQVKKELSIGYFHHIPFPSYELFRILPERAEILSNLMGADFIAFHTHDYMRHFISAVQRVLHLDFKLDEVQTDNRIVRVDALPMGINYDLFYNSSLDTKTQISIKKLKKDFGQEKLILSVDRLDYSKGILHRLEGFELFLKEHPEFKGKVSMAMVIVPSRDTVDSYAGLKTKIDEMIGSINGKYSSINWTPVHYFYHGFPFEQLTALYHMADIALVTPLRDGMNLVAKEYVAAKRDSAGVLILSEMAGAATELSDAVIINPNDALQIERAIDEALSMPKDEQLARLKSMQEVISLQTVNKWADDFVRSMRAVRQRNKEMTAKFITKDNLKEIKSQYQAAKKRLFVLDYDGTLAGFKLRPKDAVPSAELLDLIKKLSSDAKNKIVINSGRDAETLQEWFGKFNVDISAEHGAFYKEDGIWHNNLKDTQWDKNLMAILNRFTRKTPKSAIEVKKTALVWHYRNADSWLAMLREQQLVNALITPCSKLKLQIMRGNKVIEIKSPDFTKGSEIKRILAKNNYDFIFAAGDDVTDEDMFASLPKSAVTVKVGSVSPRAKFALRAQTDVLPALESLL